MNFEFATATRILFGAGKLREVGAIAEHLGRRALVVLGKSEGALLRAESFLLTLTEHGIEHPAFSLAGEPTLDVVRNGTRLAIERRCDFVISFGGGSVLDTGKAIAALVTNGGDPLDYAEVIGEGKPLLMPTLPHLAIPTTAGTGSEVTRNAVLGSPEHRVKVSLRSPLMLPLVALVDPELTYHLPPELTATTGLDALTQLIEPFVSVKANAMTDAICREGMQRAARSLRRAYEHGEDAAAREDMAVASLFGGLALANAALGAVHGFAAPLGGMFDAPHGALCAALLPHVMEVNVRALKARAAETEALRRYDEVARILTGNARATACDGVTWVGELCRAMKIRSLSAFGVGRDDFAVLAEKAGAASSMRGNPVTLTEDELTDILQRAL